MRGRSRCRSVALGLSLSLVCSWLPLAGTQAPPAPASVQTTMAKAKAGDVPAMIELAYLSLEGKVIRRDLAGGAAWYRTAAERNHPIAMNNLGWLYEHGIGVEKNVAEAARWYSRAAEAGHAPSMTNLGQLYKYGFVGAPQNDLVAVRWLRRAAEAGETVAMTELADMYRHNRVADAAGNQKEEFLAWARRAADLDNPQAMRMLASTSRLHQPEWVAWIRRAAAAGDVQSMVELATYLSSKVPMAVSNPEVYAKLPEKMKRDADRVAAANRIDPAEYRQLAGWLRQAADAGNGDAMARLGQWYSKGFGVPKDEQEAVRWIERGVAAGSVEAHMHLSDIYNTGGYGYPRDPARARALLAELAAHPDPTTAAQARQLLGNYDARQVRSNTMWDKLKPVLILGAAFVAVAAFSSGSAGTIAGGRTDDAILVGGTASSGARSCEIVSRSMMTVHGSKAIMGGPGTMRVCR
jgi:TPR repeat protein